MLAKDDSQKAQIKQKNVRHTNLLSRRHFEAPLSLANCYCPRPPGEIQRYKGVTPRLCPRYSLAMSRGSGAVVYIVWCIKAISVYTQIKF